VIGTKVTATSGKIYTVVKEIGRGGFGVVYLVQDEGATEHAIKILSPAGDPEVQRSFELEMQSAAGLRHRNILSVYDHGHVSLGADQALFTVAEYCPDGDYRNIIDEYARTRPALESVLDDFHQILDGLEVLHTKILHRDLKPENILKQGNVKKLADFGLAKFVDEATRTLTFKGFGTPRYMAPEVWDRRRITAATDLYAIGVMLFEALTGVPPFSGTDIIQVRNEHLFSAAPRAKSLNADIPDFLDGIVKKMLSKDPRDRYQSARGANDALHALARETPSNSPGQEIAARMRKHHDAKEAEELRAAESYKAAEDAQARNRYKQEELLTLFDEVMSDINGGLEEVKITTQPLATGRTYIFGNRTLLVHFFDSGALFRDPLVPGRMGVLRRRHVVHAGYVEIAENGEDREGWNIVLVRPADAMYGDWRLVETRANPLKGRTQFEPIATEAQLFADNLACHWQPVMHSFILKDKPLEKSDVYQVFSVFIPKV